MDFLQMWGLVRRGWWLLLGSLVLGLVLAAGISWRQPVLYSATSTGYVVAGSSATAAGALASNDLAIEKASSYLPLVQSRSVAERVAGELGLTSADAVASSLEGTNTGVIFRITATASTPEEAAALADAAIRATSAEANALETLTITGESTGQTVVRIVPVELARTPTYPVSPDWTRNLLIGFALGGMVGLGLILARHRLDRRVREASIAEEVTGSSVLGVVPKSTELAGRAKLSDPTGAAAESLRQLRTNLRFVSVDSPVRSIVVTSPSEGEGKSTITTHLAVLLAESGEPTVLVDADLRQPVQGQAFGVDPLVGLTQVLAGSVSLDQALVKTEHEGLSLLPAGRIPPNPSELVGSRRMEGLLETLSASSMVVIDAPPLLPVTDAALLTVAADGAIVIVDAGQTRVEQLSLAAHKLEQVSGALLGVVLNKVLKKDLGSAMYGYGYGSHTPEYGANESGRRPKPARRAQAGPVEAEPDAPSPAVSSNVDPNATP